MKPPGPLAPVLLLRPPFAFFLEGGGGDVKGLNFWGVKLSKTKAVYPVEGP